jgi:hypothetical protein
MSLSVGLGAPFFRRALVYTAALIRSARGCEGQVPPTLSRATRTVIVSGDEDHLSVRIAIATPH